MVKYRDIFQVYNNLIYANNLFGTIEPIDNKTLSTKTKFVLLALGLCPRSVGCVADNGKSLLKISILLTITNSLLLLGPPEAIYRKDKKDNYIAYWQVVCNDIDYVIISAGPETGTGSIQ